MLQPVANRDIVETRTNRKSCVLMRDMQTSGPEYRDAGIGSVEGKERVEGKYRGGAEGLGPGMERER